MSARHVVTALALVLVAGAAHAASEPAARDPKALGLCGVAPPTLVDATPKAEGIQSGPLVIQPTWDASVTSRPGWQAVFQQAINEWQAIIQDNGCSQNPLPVYFRVKPVGGFLGFTQSSVYLSTGCMFADTLDINPNFAWFVDPTPANDSEYDGTAAPPAGYDLLTVVRHELGHCVGWNFGTPTNNLLSGGTFDATRLNIPVGGGTGMHTDSTWTHGGVMDPGVPQQVRRGIKLYPDAAMIARAYGGVIPMAFVDPNYGLTGNGTAQTPFNSLTVANVFSPPGWPLLLATGSLNHVTSSYSTSTPRLWQAARGGASVVAP